MRFALGRFLPLLFLLFFASANLASAQAPAPIAAPKDSQSVALISQALQKLAGPVSVTSASLSATVNYTAGSDQQTGAATLEALGDFESNVTLSLSEGQRQEIRNGHAGQWSGPDFTAHAMAMHNTWSDAAWFFPALVLEEAANDPAVGLAYMGEETHSGFAVQHVRLWRVFPSTSGSAATLALLTHLSTEDLYLDAATSLPDALDFNLHPDTNAGQDIPVELQYSNYQKIGGVLAPALVRKLLNGSDYLDLTVTGVAVNPNISSSDFTVTVQPQGGTS